MQDAPPPYSYVVDAYKGGLIPAGDLFTNWNTSSTLTVTDQAGKFVAFAKFDTVKKGVRIEPGFYNLNRFPLKITKNDAPRNSITALVTSTTLTYNAVPAPTSFNSATVGDVDNDGFLDILGALQKSQTFIYQNWNFYADGIIWKNSRVTRDARLVDLNNDGLLDIVTNTYAPSMPGPNRNYILRNLGNGSFISVPSFANQNIQGFGETIAIADFNNDGLTDIFLPTYFRNDPNGRAVAGSRLFANRGNFNFADITASTKITGGGSLSLKGFGPDYTQLQPEGAHAIDFNLDGAIDLYVAAHLFKNNLNASFTDVAAEIGLPKMFDEGAKFFDWNNDGYFDLILEDHNKGPSLFEYNRVSKKFVKLNVFPQLRYVNAFGVNTGDLNGDGWQDVYVVGGSYKTPRIFINNGGGGFFEYRSFATESLSNWAAPALTDINKDGLPDIISAAYDQKILIAGGWIPKTYITITLLGPNGELNQHGRVVRLTPRDKRYGRTYFTQAVDGGSGYMAQGDYTLLFSDTSNTSYLAKCYMIEYPLGKLSVTNFIAISGHKYAVRAVKGNQAAKVTDTATNAIVPSWKTIN